jgi:hypothetical protein
MEKDLITDGLVNTGAKTATSEMENMAKGEL